MLSAPFSWRALHIAGHPAQNVVLLVQYTLQGTTHSTQGLWCTKHCRAPLTQRWASAPLRIAGNPSLNAGLLLHYILQGTSHSRKGFCCTTYCRATLTRGRASAALHIAGNLSLKSGPLLHYIHFRLCKQSLYSLCGPSA